MGLQFQNYSLALLSYLRHEGLGAGGVARSAAVWAFFGLSVLGTAAIRHGYEELIKMLFGRDDDDRDVEFPTRLGREFVSSIPFVSSIVGSSIYGGVPVPVVDVIVKGFEAAKSALTGKTVETRVRGYIKAADAVSRIFIGIPGTAEVSGLIRRSGVLDSDADEKRRLIHSSLQDLGPSASTGALTSGAHAAFREARAMGLIPTVDSKGRPLSYAKQWAAFRASYMAKAKREAEQED
jgi:hypothetical protein